MTLTGKALKDAIERLKRFNVGPDVDFSTREDESSTGQYLRYDDVIAALESSSSDSKLAEFRAKLKEIRDRPFLTWEEKFGLFDEVLLDALAKDKEGA